VKRGYNGEVQGLRYGNCRCHEPLSSFGGCIAAFRACFPLGVNAKQVKDIATRFLREHPEVRHVGAANLVAKALVDAFACPQ
jgi:hypothetical protein